MALKTYLVDRELVGMFLSPKHEVTLEDGSIVTYRLVEGDSELNQKKQSNNAVPRSFYVGQRLVNTEDVTLQKFIESRKDFGSRITIYDPVAINKEKLADKKRSITLLKDVAQFDKSKILEVGYVLFGREALNLIKDGDIDGLHDRIIDFAGENPERANDVIYDKNNTETLFAGYLIASGVLEVSIDEKYVTWADNGTTVYTVPNGVTALNGLVDFFQTTEGKEVKKEASSRMARKTVKKTAEKIVEKDA